MIGQFYKTDYLFIRVRQSLSYMGAMGIVGIVGTVRAVGAVRAIGIVRTLT
ncbi:hypothetical protein [Capnocytophaga sputigena]|uniref:hypothetical protein n=1 Tax=Capnocytophaga sputigena TaxID=1019 RepID=UPI0028D6F53E|nr:hypothetical protein [Capnocytophaga sputigena]